MVGLYKDPKGETIFEKSTALPRLSIVRENESKISKSETLGLRRRIKELEEEVNVININTHFPLTTHPRSYTCTVSVCAA